MYLQRYQQYHRKVFLLVLCHILDFIHRIKSENQISFTDSKVRTTLLQQSKRSHRRTLLRGDYIRPRRTRTFHAFTCERPKNELRPAWLRVGRWPDTSYFRTGPRLYRSHVKRSESQTGSINSMFLRMAPSFLLFLSKIRTLLWITVNKTWNMLRLMWGIAPFWDAVLLTCHHMSVS